MPAPAPPPHPIRRARRGRTGPHGPRRAGPPWRTATGRSRAQPGRRAVGCRGRAGGSGGRGSAAGSRRRPPARPVVRPVGACARSRGALRLPAPMPAEKPRRARSARAAPERVGVWLFGARGGLATTLVVRARAIARGLGLVRGLRTETERLAGTPLAAIGDLVFGGHEVRPGTLHDAAREMQERTGALPADVLHALRGDLARIDRDIVPGTLVNAGKTIEQVLGVRARTATLR